MAANNQPVNIDQILSKARENFEENRKDIQDLLDIHREQEGEQHGKAGRRRDSIQVLHRAAVVMLAACWEAYVEDLFNKASECLLASHRDGWKTILEKYVDEKLHYFHNPSPKKVNNLFKCLELEKVSDAWGENAKNKLDEMISSRHQIAHEKIKEGDTDFSRPNKTKVTDYCKNINHLIEETERKVKEHITELISQGNNKTAS